MIVYNGYPLSVIVAVSIHGLLLATLLYMQSIDRVEALDLIQPTVIKALTVEENPQLRNQQIQERQRLERIEQQNIAQAQQQQEEQRQREAQAQAEAEAEAEAEARRQREAEALRQRQQEESRQEELAQAERERQQREAEEQRRRELAEAEARQQQEQRRLQEIDDERRAQAEAQAAEVARTDREMVQSATGIIQQYLQQSWSRPPSARNGMRVEIRLQMLPTGEVIDVSITYSSGDAAFDRAAEQAVYRAAPFRELQNLPARVFNQNFRTLTITFQPEDLLN